MVKFNNTIFTKGVTTGHWETRPKTGATASQSSATDGDYFQPTGGAIYRYSDDIGEWVRPFVYDGTPVLDAKITGKILPSAESPAWTHGITSSATVTTDGTRVTIAGNAKVYHDHEQTQKSHFIQGYYLQEATGYNGSAFAIKDGVRNALINMGITGTPIKWVKLDGTGDGEWINQIDNMSGHGQGGAVNLDGPERYYEMYFAATGGVGRDRAHPGLYVYVDHEESPSTVGGYISTMTSIEAGTYGNLLSSVSSETIYFVGSEGASAATFTLREFFFGRY